MVVMNGNPLVLNLMSLSVQVIVTVIIKKDSTNENQSDFMRDSYQLSVLLDRFSELKSFVPSLHFMY